MELSAPDVFRCRKIDFHFGHAAADYGENRHTGAYRFMRLKKTFLYKAVEGGVELGVAELVLVVPVFGCNLL